ncbi:MAG: gliding motility protein GldM [Maribacter dokdonensis]|jgi:gliding motility-associated protein GldM|uniref:Gliding motility-associated protein GldM n=3 Tax=Maribacter dokdonensis TaxID=320912 RepID=A0A1H4JWF0_9FLAO|nr:MULTISPECIES: gliding motility protein GldM [Maribacter]HAF78096.1 gliding motility protein GldM [Maribacter sp.]APA63806.1 gliding motility protein GldM [Maribacter sp. 1_2014MBL_MicDiv]KSA13386.1 Gliding motility protein [Maribacter dokdonensis DSW-8]MDP2526326.1 gliding motility protein GldM [Maribacter dokdonensis]PHN95462.1 gliding motility protein GldM [Maribacter sp. 6B07]|tara:strand:- start:31721 stop:33280 length:1560 start_codon:yes stop_codon:yes gene_type:complete
MAGGKQSPRQKMVNLMYLIFIAMLALNMSKEVLAAFGIMNEKLETSNEKTTASNNAFLESLGTKASEDAAKYDKLYQNAQQIKAMSQEYYDYLEGLKKGMMEGIEDPKDYARMDMSDYLDQKLFQGENLSEDGKKFMSNLTGYRDQVAAIVPAALKQSVIDRFQTGDENGKVEKRDGTKQDWINYHYEGYPLVASLAKLTQLQADVKITEEAALKSMLAGELTEQVSLKNFATSLSATKSAYYAGEKYDGKIIISKTDNSSTPVRAELTLDGRKLSEGSDYKLEAGGVKMLIGSGSAGDHEVKGTIYFKQDGEEIPVEVNNSFATISKPNAALIAADKMNVVYRGVANPMSISIPGIPNNKVRASAPGLKAVSGSKYVMTPGTGRNVTITASGTLPDGQSVSSKSEFRIKDIPRPEGSISKQTGSLKLPKRNVEIATIGAGLEDFDFDLNLAVSGFKFKVPGQPTVSVRGNKMNAKAKQALSRAKRGDVVQIFDIEAYITNNKSYKLKKVSPVVVEITN